MRCGGVQSGLVFSCQEQRVCEFVRGRGTIRAADNLVRFARPGPSKVKTIGQSWLTVVGVFYCIATHDFD